jgi:hypothetical protein
VRHGLPKIPLKPSKATEGFPHCPTLAQIDPALSKLPAAKELTPQERDPVMRPTLEELAYEGETRLELARED